MDLALNNLQRWICHHNQPTIDTSMNIYVCVCLVSFFNGILTPVRYSMPKPSFKKNTSGTI